MTTLLRFVALRRQRLRLPASHRAPARPALPLAA